MSLHKHCTHTLLSLTDVTSIIPHVTSQTLHTHTAVTHRCHFNYTTCHLTNIAHTHCCHFYYTTCHLTNIEHTHCCHSQMNIHLMLITNHKILLLDSKQFTIKANYELSEIKSISLSPHRDNIAIIHISQVCGVGGGYLIRVIQCS